MAGLTIGGRRPVGAALPGGNAAVVAAATLPRRAFEAAVHMAGRAIDAVVAADQWETGAEVVEGSLLGIGARRQQRCRGRAEAEQERKHPQQSAHQSTAYRVAVSPMDLPIVLILCLVRRGFQRSSWGFQTKREWSQPMM